MTKVSPIDPAATVTRLPTVATLPTSVARLVAAVEDPACDASKLEAIIRTDPALAARVLKLVNSAACGLSRPVDDLGRAVALLGSTRVRNLAVAVGLGGLFRGARLGGRATPADLWSHCAAVAVAARELVSTRHGRAAGEAAFLAGLMHDVGLLAAMHLFPEALSRACDAADGGADFRQAERDVYGSDHTQVGHALAVAWSFPPVVRSTARDHHGAGEGADEHARTVAAVACADALCCATGTGFSGTRADDPAAYLRAAGLDEADLSRTREALPKLVRAVEALAA